MRLIHSQFIFTEIERMNNETKKNELMDIMENC